VCFLHEAKREVKIAKRSELLKRISLMLSTPVQLNYFLHTSLVLSFSQRRGKKKEASAGVSKLK
jgi:hypothetical protein